MASENTTHMVRLLSQVMSATTIGASAASTKTEVQSKVDIYGQAWDSKKKIQKQSLQQIINKLKATRALESVASQSVASQSVLEKPAPNPEPIEPKIVKPEDARKFEDAHKPKVARRLEKNTKTKIRQAEKYEPLETITNSSSDEICDIVGPHLHLHSAVYSHFIAGWLSQFIGKVVVDGGLCKTCGHIFIYTKDIMYTLVHTFVRTKPSAEQLDDDLVEFLSVPWSKYIMSLDMLEQYNLAPIEVKSNSIVLTSGQVLGVSSVDSANWLFNTLVKRFYADTVYGQTKQWRRFVSHVHQLPINRMTPAQQNGFQYEKLLHRTLTLTHKISLADILLID